MYPPGYIRHPNFGYKSNWVVQTQTTCMTMQIYHTLVLLVRNAEIHATPGIYNITETARKRIVVCNHLLQIVICTCRLFKQYISSNIQYQTILYPFTTLSIIWLFTPHPKFFAVIYTRTHAHTHTHKEGCKKRKKWTSTRKKSNVLAVISINSTIHPQQAQFKKGPD